MARFGKRRRANGFKLLTAGFNQQTKARSQEFVTALIIQTNPLHHLDQHERRCSRISFVPGSFFRAPQPLRTKSGKRSGG